MIKAVPPKCDTLFCREEAIDVREIYKLQGGKELRAFCPAHLAEYDLMLDELLSASANEPKETE